MTKRHIQVGSQLIFHMIEGQAGTFAKALLEYCMNSIDGEASKVKITMTPHGFTVEDDGRGVNRLNEMERCLATLGFDHDDGIERTYGKFGIGRSQAWAFAPTAMRTSTFQMNVDIRNWGLEYELHENLPEQIGFTVSGEFYSPMTPSDVDRTERELAELATYAQIPVIMNGKTISKLPQDQKWDIETDQCYIKLQERGQLSVYNLGVLVRSYPAYSFGTGGVVVSKVPLEVNLARNDVLEAKCAVWKEVRSFIRKAAGETTRRKATLNDTQREFLIRQLIDGETVCGNEEVDKMRLVKDVTGKAHPLKRLFSLDTVTICSKKQQRMGTRVHEKKLAFVLHPSMLDFLGARTAEEVREKLVAMTTSKFSQQYSYFNGKVLPFDDFQDAFNEGHDPLENKDLSTAEKVAVRAMNKSCEHNIRRIFNQAVGESPTPRKIILGVSETAEAWTDGKSYVAIERETAKLLRQGTAGATRLAGVIIHEICHDTPDLSGHGHTPEFFEKFHEVMLGPRTGVGHLVTELMKHYTNELKKAGLKPTQAMLKSEDAEFIAENTPVS